LTKTGVVVCSNHVFRTYPVNRILGAITEAFLDEWFPKWAALPPGGWWDYLGREGAERQGGGTGRWRWAPLRALFTYL
jgi:hypothetical protein